MKFLRFLRKAPRRLWEWIGHFFGLHYQPSIYAKVLLALIPLGLLSYWYVETSHEKRAAHEAACLEEGRRVTPYKLMPFPGEMYDAAKEYVEEVDIRTEKELFKEDFKATMKRFLWGFSIFSITSLFVGVLMGLFPWLRTMISPLLTFISIVPALALLPIVYLLAGADEFGKITLIVMGSVFLMTRDIARLTSDIPRTDITRALTLGANPIRIFWRVILPQVMPRFFETCKIYLTSAWLFLITAEYTSATFGLAARINFKIKTSYMAQIIPIALFLGVIGLGFTVLFMLINRVKYPWYKPSVKN